MTTTEHDAAAERVAYRMAYAPLRSAQHAFDIIYRNTGNTLAKQESYRLEAIIAALSATPAVRDDSGEVADDVSAAMVEASTWLRQCSDWLLSNDLDMKCPMEKDPLDIADALDILAALPKRGPHLREALQAIIDGEVPRLEGKKWRSDGLYSKNDQCSHGIPMYEDCHECTAAFARAALEPRKGGE